MEFKFITTLLEHSGEINYILKLNYNQITSASDDKSIKYGVFLFNYLFTLSFHLRRTLYLIILFIF